MAGAGGKMPLHALSFLNAEERARVTAAPVVLKKGEMLFQRGEAAEGVFFVEKGRLAILQETGFNERTQVVALLDPGASVGEGGALGDSFREAAVLAVEDSLLYCLDRERLTALGEHNPQILIRILKRLLYVSNVRLQKSSERLAHIL
jgi:CRP/FNR family transcriptional regulator, cyclic AMP receptor protein